MFARLSQSQPAQGADVIARAIGVLALMALAVIHVVDLPPTPGTCSPATERPSTGSPPPCWSRKPSPGTRSERSPRRP
jgi:hypothetical protein